jgi:hypothetical protein
VNAHITFLSAEAFLPALSRQAGAKAGFFSPPKFLPIYEKDNLCLRAKQSLLYAAKFYCPLFNERHSTQVVLPIPLRNNGDFYAVICTGEGVWAV